VIACPNLLVGNFRSASHLAWMYDIFCRTGIALPFPIIADRSGEIARKYGMIANDISKTETVRNVYIIDEEGIIRVILIYPLNVGRWIPEIIRTVEALQIADCADTSTPANWRLGEQVIIKAPKTYPQLQERIVENEQGNDAFSWYLTFKELEKKYYVRIRT
jgi:peroxiredoxin (alkyl hydroperoxide reductase subunit C)